jgi:hypothetical protein
VPAHPCKDERRLQDRDRWRAAESAPGLPSRTCALRSTQALLGAV